MTPEKISQIRVAAYTGGRHVPGARYRLRQLVPALREFSVEVDEFAAPWGSYPPRTQVLRPAWLVGTLLSRLPHLARGRRCDITFLQREFVSTLCTLEPLTRAPRLLDVDDAIWLSMGEGAAQRLSKLCDVVVCGNEFLADVFSRWNSRVEILPTAVDTERFHPIEEEQHCGALILGWSGTSGNLQYLHAIDRELAIVLARHPHARLQIICDRPPALQRVPADRVEWIRWTAADEPGLVRAWTAGLMPLQNGPWERGKCSFKMLTYMASGIPSVVSPVGMNRKVLTLGHLGFGASTGADWVDALECVLTRPAEAAALGREARRVAVAEFSLGVIAPRLASILLRTAGR